MKNAYGSISTCLGTIVLAFTLSMTLAPGRLSHWFHTGISSALPSRPVQNGPEFRDLGFFSMTVHGEHLFFASLCIVMASACLVISLISLTKKEHTLLPAIGMFSCVGALSLISGVISVIYAAIAFAGAYIIQKREPAC